MNQQQIRNIKNNLNNNIISCKNYSQSIQTVSHASIGNLNLMLQHEDSMVNNQNKQFFKQIIEKSQQINRLLDFISQNIGYQDSRNSEITNNLLSIHNMYQKMQFIKSKILSQDIVRSNLKTIIQSDVKFSQFMKNNHSLLLQLNSHFSKVKTSQIQVEIDI